MDLFKEDNPVNENAFTPLADRMRPGELSSFVGHEDLLGVNGLIPGMLENKQLFSIILWAPPGTGKTTLAQIIANESGAVFYHLSAVDSGVKQVREVIRLGKHNKRRGRQTLLFIDEIHRFNKAQQDALLSSVERGDIVLIGATTENPSFEVIPPLLSRTRVFRMEPLTAENLNVILDRALKEDELLKSSSPNLRKNARKLLIDSSGGDARKLLNTLEIAVRLTGKNGAVTLPSVKEALLTKTSIYDKAGDAHYDTISAFIKSVRGSDPDAALYWMARMLEAGEDPKFIARRLVILASEDIGNADPFGLVLANSAFSAVIRLGMPECRIVLAQTVTYLASAPKSNSSYLAIMAAEEEVRSGKAYPVPLHLRNAPTKLMEDEGYADGYIYPHDHPNHFAEQQYLPPELSDTIFFEPTNEGRENKITERLASFWKKRRDRSS